MAKSSILKKIKDHSNFSIKGLTDEPKPQNATLNLAF